MGNISDIRHKSSAANMRYPWTCTVLVVLLPLLLAVSIASCITHENHRRNGSEITGTENITGKVGKVLNFYQACDIDDDCDKPDLVCDLGDGVCRCRDPAINYKGKEMYPQLEQVFNEATTKRCESVAGSVCTKLEWIKDGQWNLYCGANAECVNDTNLRRWNVSGERFGLCRCVEGTHEEFGICRSRKTTIVDGDKNKTENSNSFMEPTEKKDLNLTYNDNCGNDDECRKYDLVCSPEVGKCLCRSPYNLLGKEATPQHHQVFNGDTKRCESVHGSLCTKPEMIMDGEKNLYCIPFADCVHDDNVESWNAPKEIFGFCRCKEGFEFKVKDSVMSCTTSLDLERRPTAAEGNYWVLGLGLGLLLLIVPLTVLMILFVKHRMQSDSYDFKIKETSVPV